MIVLPSRLAVLALAGALVLSGCSGGDDTPSADPSTSTSTSGSAAPSDEASPYLPVPDGVELTAQGSTLGVGDKATVAFEPRQDTVGVVDIIIDRLEKTTFKKSFSGWKLDQATRKTNPYFVRATLKNVGDTDLGGRDVPLYVVDGNNTLIEASAFASTFKPCTPGTFPKKFRTGDKTSVCLVFLSPDHGDLTAVSFRPTQDFNPITWEGKLETPDKKPAKKSTGPGNKSGNKNGAKGR